MILPPVLEDAGPRAAQLLIDGLSVFCFNKGGKYWEVAFPRQTNHDLKISIQSLDNKGQPVGEKNEIEVDKRVVSFDIRLTDGAVSEFSEGGPFANDFVRDAPGADPHDLQWMIDVSGDELQDGPFLGLRTPPPRRVTLARIHHSLLCNRAPESEPVVISLRHGRPDDRESFELGRTNTEILGVLLTNGPGEIRFESDPPRLLNIDPLPYDDDHRYEIQIINDDNVHQNPTAGFVRGDLDLLYDEVIRVDSMQKALWARPSNPGEIAPDGDCHGTRFGGTTLQPLIDG